MKTIRAAIVSLALFTVLTGLFYPLLVTAIAKLAFPRRAEGSLIVREGTIAGSELIGQPFAAPRYFWGRLSATAPSPFNGAASSGSNLGPGNPALLGAARRRIDALRAWDPVATGAIPADLVTASGSGLDPQISVAAALYQAPRVARAREMDEERVRELVSLHTEGRQLGFLGEPRVNVLELNLALDAVAEPLDGEGPSRADLASKGQ